MIEEFYYTNPSPSIILKEIITLKFFLILKKVRIFEIQR